MKNHMHTIIFQVDIVFTLILMGNIFDSKFRLVRSARTKKWWTNLLSDASHDGKVLREVSCQNPSDAVGIQVFQLLQLCKEKFQDI